MNRRQVFAVLAAALAGASLSGCAEQTRSAVQMDPRADAALRRMSTTLSDAKSFRFHGATTMDEPVETGHLAKFARDFDIAVLRPNRVVVRSEQGNDLWRLWYKGTTLTVFDGFGNVYASATVPGRIDGMLDVAAREYGLTLPLGDFVSSDPYKALSAGALTGKYVGQFDTEGIRCDHILLTHDELDCQIWIQTGAQAVPRQFLIDYKRLPGRPQFTAVLSGWDLQAPQDEAQFEPVLSRDAKRVGLKALVGKVEGE